MGEVCCLDKVRIFNHITVDNMTLVNNLRFDIFSVAQLCQNKKNKIVFTTDDCYVECISTWKILLK